MFGTGTLRVGSSGSGVEELQQWLIDRRYLVGRRVASRDFDEETEQALLAFQFSVEIDVDGVVGGQTRTAARDLDPAQTAESAGWNPSAKCHVLYREPFGYTGKLHYTTDSRRGVLHTTETPNLPSYKRGGHDPGQYAPHFTIGRDGAGGSVNVWQHVPIILSARALAHPRHTVQTNNHGAVQIEIIGEASESESLETRDADLFSQLRGLMRWTEANGPVARVSHHTFHGHEAEGVDGVARLSDSDWLSSSGWLGHQHVPNNSHWDPGLIDIDALLI